MYVWISDKVYPPRGADILVCRLRSCSRPLSLRFVPQFPTSRIPPSRNRPRNPTANRRERQSARWVMLFDKDLRQHARTLEGQCSIALDFAGAAVPGESDVNVVTSNDIACHLGASPRHSRADLQFPILRSCPRLTEAVVDLIGFRRFAVGGERMSIFDVNLKGDIASRRSALTLTHRRAANGSRNANVPRGTCRDRGCPSADEK